MSTSAVEQPPPAAGSQSSAEITVTPATRLSNPDRELHAQDNDRVFQAAGNQYIFGQAMSTPATAANTLPRDIAVFTGRDDELDSVITTVVSLLATGATIPIFAIDGMPGVGKTSFAVRVARLLSAGFPGGQMFLDMHAHTAGTMPVEPAEALLALLSADGARADEIPDDIDGRSALWRARIASRRSILVLDNVAGRQQVEPLLPGAAGCLVLVTSRRRLTGLGVRHAAITVPLDPLPPGLAADLFSRLAGRTSGDGQEPAIAQLAELCGCLPLAISLLAAQLRPEPQWSAQRLVDDLSATRDRLAHMRAEDIEVAAAFDLSYERLPVARRRFFRRLCLSPGADIDIYAAAAVGGVELATARRHLDALYNDHMVEQPVQGRYRLHSLLREYGRTLLARDPAQQRDLATGRLLDYYQHAAAIAEQYITPRPHRGRGSQPARPPVAVPALAGAGQAAAWLDAELPNLLACATYVVSQCDDARLIGMSAAFASLLRSAGPYRESVALHRAAADAADRRGDRAARGAALYQVGVLLRRAGDYAGAAEALNEARGLHRELNDRLSEAEVLTAAGIVWRLAGRYDEATKMLDEALRCFQGLADPVGQAGVLDELAVIRWLTDDYPAAIRLLDQALALYRQVGNPQGQADVLLHLGMVRRLKHDYSAGVAALEEAMRLYRGLGNRVGLAHTQFSLGVGRRLLGDRQSAARFLAESLRTYQEIGDHLGQANALKQLGILRRLAGDHAGATQALRDSLSLYQRLGNRRGRAEALQALGVVWQLTGDTDRAANDLAEALAIYQDLGGRAGQAEVLNHIGDLLLDTGDPAALDRFRVALRLAREVHNPLEEARALEGIGRCRLRQRDTGQARRRLAAALEVYQRIGAPEAARVGAALTSLNSDRQTTVD